VDNISKLGIKYSELIGIFNSEGNSLILTDVDALKYRYQKGLETLLVYTINDEY